MSKKLNSNPLEIMNAEIDITLAASVTTDGMDITIQLKREGNDLFRCVAFEWWISEDAEGEGLTADTYSGDVTTVTGTELVEHTSKKLFTALTDVTGTFVALAVDSANPADQYIAVRHPGSGEVFVSEVSGTNWEGA